MTDETQVQALVRECKARSALFNRKVSALALLTCRVSGAQEAGRSCLRRIEQLSAEIETECARAAQAYPWKDLCGSPEERRLRVAVEKVLKDEQRMIRYLSILARKFEGVAPEEPPRFG